MELANTKYGNTTTGIMLLPTNPPFFVDSSAKELKCGEKKKLK